MKTSPTRLLLIESDPGEAQRIADLLSASEGWFELEQAATLAAGLECLAGREIGVVLIDLSLPDSRGPEVLRRLQRHAPLLPVVLLVAADEEYLAVQAIQAGAQDYLIKEQLSAPLLEHAVHYAFKCKETEQVLRERERFLVLLNEMTRLAIEVDDLEDMLHMLSNHLSELVGGDSCYLTLWDEASLRAIPVAAYGEMHEGYSSLQIEPGEPTLTAAVLEAGRPLAIDDVGKTPYVSERVAALFSGRSLLGLPLFNNERRLGALLIAFNEPHRFTDREIARGELVARQIALAVSNALLVRDLEAEVAARTAEILAEKEKSETILRHAGEAIALVDRNMLIRYSNPAMTTLTGWEASELSGRSLLSFWREHLPAPTRQAILRAMSGGDVWKGELSIRRKDGRFYDAAVTIAPVRDAREEIGGYVTTHRDISSIKDLERARSHFIANVSHQLRTPAANLKLYTRMLIEGRHPERRDGFLQVVSGQVDRLCQLIDGILAITELDSGPVVAIWVEVSVAQVVKNTIDNYRSVAGAHHVELVLAPIPAGLPLLLGDAVRLVQALGEIVRNAITFTPPAGLVEVSASRIESRGQVWVQIVVRDTGPGILPEEQERVFERFFRGSAVEAGQVPGTGLGLSLAQEIVVAHGGRIWIESVPDEGTSVFILLPEYVT